MNRTEHQETQTCTVCNGTRTQDVRPKLMQRDLSFSDLPVVQIPCVGCDGTGTMTPRQKLRWETYQSIWCECEQDHPSRHYRDGEHPEMYKHHYRCTHCGKVVQIG